MISCYYLVAELDEEEYDDGIEVRVRVNPEWASSHAKISAKTHGCIGPTPKLIHHSMV